MDWLKMIRGEKPAAPAKKESHGLKSVRKCAEKIVIGIEAMPKISLKHIIMYRVVPELMEDGYGKPVYRDSEGYLVGVLPSHIVEDKQDLIDLYAKLEGEGWIFESGDPQAVSLVRRGKKK